jgi:hypothetical protein
VTVLCIFGGPFIVGGWVAWLGHRRKELKIELKREMIAAGMSADEIVQVLNAGEGSGSDAKP